MPIYLRCIAQPTSTRDKWMPCSLLGLDGMAGDDIYLFNSSFVDLGTKEIGDYENADSDTLDFTGFADDITLDLTDGSPQALCTNLTLALADESSIEVVLCGSGDSTVIGNSRDNTLTGSDGADTLRGGERPSEHAHRRRRGRHNFRRRWG